MTPPLCLFRQPRVASAHVARVSSFRQRPRRDSGSRRSAAALGVSIAATTLALAVPWTGTIYVLFGVALAAFLRFLWCELRAPSVHAKTVFAAGAFLLALAIIFPVRHSHDAYAYADYGQMIARYHASPYTSVPADFSDDFWFRWVSPRWQHTGSVYGPAFVGISAVFMKIAGTSILVTRLLFQSLAALAVAAAGWLVWRRARDPVAVALVVVNPLVIVNVVNNGHNDALVGLAFLAAILLVERKRAPAAGAVLAVAALVKVTAIVPAAAIAFWLWRREDLRVALRFAIPFSVVAAAGTLLAGGASVLIPLGPASKLVSYSSFWHGAIRVIGDATGTSGRGPVRVMANLLVVGLAVLVVWKRTDREDVRGFSALIVVLYLLGAAYVLPWYLMWVIPVVALDWRSPVALVSFAYGSVLCLAFFALSNHTGAVLLGVRTFFTAAAGVVEVAAIVFLARSMVARSATLQPSRQAA